jgi:hypothetical protein
MITENLLSSGPASTSSNNGNFRNSNKGSCGKRKRMGPEFFVLNSTMFCYHYDSFSNHHNGVTWKNLYDRVHCGHRLRLLPE